MHIDTIPNRNSRPAYLLRESVRDGKHVRKRTLANLSSLPIEQIEAIRRILKGERLGPIEDGLEVVRSRAHGHVAAVTTAMQRLGFAKLIDARPSRERDLVVAMVAERIIAPEASKLGMTRAWTDATLGEELGVADADEDELYAAMDWVAAMVATGRLKGAGAIGVRAGKVLDKYKVAKHFDLAIAEASFEGHSGWARAVAAREPKVPSLPWIVSRDLWRFRHILFVLEDE
jgi:hypothetical protein